MTQQYTPSGERALDPELDALRRMLRAVTDEMHRLQQALSGEAPPATDAAGRVLAEVRQCIRLALLMERDFEQRTAKKDGGAVSAPLDLNAARSSIGCRLDRLRAAQGTD